VYLKRYIDVYRMYVKTIKCYLRLKYCTTGSSVSKTVHRSLQNVRKNNYKSYLRLKYCTTGSSVSKTVYRSLQSIRKALSLYSSSE